ncbi:MAG: hypothetical protein ACK6BC_09020, partial [Cyanobacteriota bacterium]
MDFLPGEISATPGAGFGSGVPITVRDWFYGSSYQLSALRFADRSSLTNAQIALLPVPQFGTAGNDDLYGSDGIDVISGLAGNDNISSAG